MKGIHHLGLAVSDLAGSSSFFCDLLGWNKVRKIDDYPAIFVSNGRIMFTLWQTGDGSTPFDRNRSIGLHHAALKMDSKEELMKSYKNIEKSDLVHVKFSPEPLRGGPAQHMICIEPSGIRVEFIWAPE